MNTLLRTLLILLSLNLFHAVSAQQKPTPKKLTEFQFMIGNWEGSGTYYSQQGTHSSDVSESVKYALDSTILVIQGTGIDQNGVKQHDAVGILYFENGNYYMHAFTMQGNHVIADVVISGDQAIDWGFELPNGGKINYAASFKEGLWIESGTYTTPNSSQSFPTVDMKLSRK